MKTCPRCNGKGYHKIWTKDAMVEDRALNDHHALRDCTLCCGEGEILSPEESTARFRQKLMDSKERRQA